MKIIWLPARALSVRVAGQTVALGALLAGTPLGEAALFDRAVSSGLAYTRRLFQRAARHVGRPEAAAILAAARRLDAVNESRWQALQRAWQTSVDLGE